MDRGDGRNVQRCEPIENLLAFGNESAQLTALRLLEQRLEIGAHNENRFLRRGDDDAFDRCIFFDRIEMFAQVPHRRRIENVRAGFGPIESEHADPVSINFTPDHRSGRGHRAHIGEFLSNSKCGEAHGELDRINRILQD